MFLEVKMQQDRCRWRNKVKLEKVGELLYFEANKQQRRYRLT